MRNVICQAVLKGEFPQKNRNPRKPSINLLDIAENGSDIIGRMFDFPTAYFTENLLASVLAVAVVYILTRIIYRLLDKWVRDAKALYAARKRTVYGATVLAIILVATIWAQVVSGFTTFLGIIGAGVALALKDPLTSVAGWLYLAVSRHYSLGDRIEIKNLKGDVVDISVFHTTLLEIDGWVGGEQSTGRLVNIPHNWLFTHKVYNYTTGFRFIWVEVAVIITFESDWKTAVDIITKRAEEISADTAERAAEAIRSTKNRYLIKVGTLTPIVYTTIEDNGVKLTARFLTPVRMRRSKESQLYEAILQDFGEEKNIDLAYPTYRIVPNATSRK
ncbi:mechanosensitive ion channel family protein [bacterium]|nr:MAG: mechanosensitive ion channel family protein [bacterium]